jgi:hypothetical protein
MTMKRTLQVVILLILAGTLLPAALWAQQPPPRPDTAALVSEREVFTYPTFERRNPFVRVLSGSEGGPRFEELELIGVIFSPNPDLSVALFGPRGGGEAEGAPQQRARRNFRARRGQVLGNVRILEIHQTRVVVEVEEFGLTEQRIMELQRPGEGGSS